MVLGDVVVSVNKKEVETPAALRFQIAVKPGGDLISKFGEMDDSLSLNCLLRLLQKASEEYNKVKGASTFWRSYCQYFTCSSRRVID